MDRELITTHSGGKYAHKIRGNLPGIYDSSLKACHWRCVHHAWIFGAVAWVHHVGHLGYGGSISVSVRRLVPLLWLFHPLCVSSDGPGNHVLPVYRTFYPWLLCQRWRLRIPSCAPCRIHYP